VRHDLTIEGPAHRLRPVVAEDAATILELRRHPDLSRFIHETAPSLEAQAAWLEAYFARPDDCYWAVERRADGRTEGFVGIYDIADGWAEWGRWVLRPGSLAAAESAWLVYEAGLGLLDLHTMISRVLTGNRTVLSLHARYGVETLGTLPRYARIGGIDHDAVEQRMTPQLWTTSGPVLLGMARRAAALLERSAVRC
jgi:RimJ/RimL family protein N-acetyltransferase